jgi:hypothetical protein
MFLQVWDVQNGEKIRFTHRFLQWSVADVWSRPLYRIDTGGGPAYPNNYIYNGSVCLPFLGCGQIKIIPNYLPVDMDTIGYYQSNTAYPGNLPIPAEGTKTWTVLEDAEGSGSLVTVLVQGQKLPTEQILPIRVSVCPPAGCWAPPPAPPVVVENVMMLWSDPTTWNGTQDHPANPLNTLKPILISKGNYNYQVVSWQNWTEKIPGPGDNVWVPPWKKVSALSLSFRTFQIRYFV